MYCRICQPKVNTKCYIASCVFLAGEKKINCDYFQRMQWKSCRKLNLSRVFGNWHAYTFFPEQLLLGHSCLTPTSGLCKDLCVCNKSWCCAAVIQNGGTAACFQARVLICQISFHAQLIDLLISFKACKQKSWKCLTQKLALTLVRCRMWKCLLWLFLLYWLAYNMIPEQLKLDQLTSLKHCHVLPKCT